LPESIARRRDSSAIALREDALQQATSRLNERHLAPERTASKAFMASAGVGATLAGLTGTQL
jgi:hypothetical protein